MLDVRLTFPTPEGSKDISLDSDRVSFGRGSEADHRFADQGLSRLHATVYREGDRVWIVDENSSNGTFVNGARVGGAGTPLYNGDSIRIGNETVLNVLISERASAAMPDAAVTPSAGSFNPVAATALANESPISLLPIIAIAFAIVVISMSVVLIAFKVFGFGGNETVAVSNDYEFDDFDLEPRTPKPSITPTKTPYADTPKPDERSGDDLPNSQSSGNTSSEYKVPAGKQYLQMSDAEKREYIAERSMRIAQVIGNRASDKIPPEAVDKIKSFADGYARRINVKPMGGCRMGDNLQATYERASKNAPFIVRAFNERGIDPRIGIYLAMIESEHCVCLQSPTGPLGMFQFTRSTGEIHGLKTIQGASPTNPDERCEPEPSARAAASYMKALTGRYGTGPASVPLAIGSYNSGEGGLSSNLVKALESGEGLPRDFWTLISRGEILSKQFQAENFKYVPKFFAAAIVGENPQDFGMNLRPISSYTR